MGEALGDFLLVDSASSNVYRKTYARILVEIDVSKGLPEMIKLASPNGSWIQLLDYEGIPFRCRKCHKIGHLAARCSSEKVRSKKSPSWWKGVSDNHYTIQKVSSDGDGLVGSSQDSLVADYVVVSNDSNDAPTVVTNTVVPPSVVVVVDPIVAPLTALSQEGAIVPSTAVVPSRSDGGVSSPTARVLEVGCDVVDLAWQKAARKVEDGWTTIKGKKVKSSTPSFDMSLCSQKTRPKCKS